MRSILLSFLTLLTACVDVDIRAGQQSVAGWRKVDAEGHYSFRLPRTMKLSSEVRCEECAWGSTYSDTRITLYAEFSKWNEEYAATYLEKQQDYVKEWTEIDGKRAKIQTWRSEEDRKFSYIAEVRFYDANQKLMARMSASCKGQREIQIAKMIFRSVDFPK